MNLVRSLSFALLWLMPLTNATVLAQPSLARDPDGWRENYAYSLGIQAYIFGYPYVALPSLRWAYVVKPPATPFSPYAPINHFFHWRQLADASYQGGGGTNNDTLYSTAWLDLSREPLILSHPDMGNRFFYFQLASLDSDNFGAIGKRTTGSKAGSFALIGPDWQGSLPPQIQKVFRSRTNHAFILGRTVANSAEDAKVVNLLQDQYTLIPLSYWGKGVGALPASRDVWKPWDRKTDPLADWKTMNRAMTENPPELRLKPLLDIFATIGIGPRQDVETQDAATKQGLSRAAVDARQIILDINASRHPFLWKSRNGWDISARHFGHMGLVNDFLRRAVIAHSGIVSPEGEEASYYQSNSDGSGALYDAGRKYTITFPAGGLPKVEGFWSLTMYNTTTDNQYNLVPNPINRYSIGDRSKGVKFNQDGSLTLYIQSTSPGKDKEADWLPSATSGPFALTFRTYLPGAEIVAQNWFPPPVVRASAGGG